MDRRIRESDNLNLPTYPREYVYVPDMLVAIVALDEKFAREQYDALKDNFLKRFPFAGFKEYHDRGCLLGMDIDAGPIIFNMSPSGTAFAVGSVTYFNDGGLRGKLLKTAETAGTTVSRGGRRHYLL